MNNTSPALVIKASKLSKRFHDGERTLEILQELDFEAAPGEAVAILGRSGSGKSTLLHLLGLLDLPSSGEITLQGQSTAGMNEAARNRMRNREIGFLFQNFHLLPELTALENVALPARLAGEANATQRADKLLAEVGLAERTGHRPKRLSGGEQQRVALAQALINQPAILLCDEPTGNLDQETSVPVLDILFKLVRQQGTTLIMVTHDKQLAERTDRSLQLEKGVLK